MRRKLEITDNWSKNNQDLPEDPSNGWEAENDKEDKGAKRNEIFSAYCRRKKIEKCDMQSFERT
jgi:hypothetical protein